MSVSFAITATICCTCAACHAGASGRPHVSRHHSAGHHTGAAGCACISRCSGAPQLVAGLVQLTPLELVDMPVLLVLAILAMVTVLALLDQASASATFPSFTCCLSVPVIVLVAMLALVSIIALLS